MLLRSPKLIRSICEQVRDSVPERTPVTAKIRLGYDSDEQFEEILDALSGVALSEITIHARTKRQGYRPPAHWHPRQARLMLPYPVIANGELWTPADVARCAEISGCDAFMLARGRCAARISAPRSLRHTEARWVQHSAGLRHNSYW